MNLDQHHAGSMTSFFSGCTGISRAPEIYSPTSGCLIKIGSRCKRILEDCAGVDFVK
jgi:hypothetical protein